MPKDYFSKVFWIIHLLKMLKYSNLNQQKTSRCPCILNFIILLFTFILLSIALLLCAFVSVKAQFLHLPKYKKLFASCPVCNAYLHTAALRNLGDFLQEDRFDKKTPASNTKLIKGHDFHVLISEGGYTDVSQLCNLRHHWDRYPLAICQYAGLPLWCYVFLTRIN